VRKDGGAAREIIDAGAQRAIDIEVELTVLTLIPIARKLLGHGDTAYSVPDEANWHPI
jgi:hypothetical protein